MREEGRRQESTKNRVESGEKNEIGRIRKKCKNEEGGKERRNGDCHADTVRGVNMPS